MTPPIVGSCATESSGVSGTLMKFVAPDGIAVVVGSYFPCGTCLRGSRCTMTGIMRSPLR